MTRKRGLAKGRGLDALLGKVQQAQEDVSQIAESNMAADHIVELQLGQLQRGQYQPRQNIDQNSLKELSDSIRQHGIMQPIVVRAIAEDSYEIIAGERRWRAAQLAGLQVIPAIVRQLDNEVVIALSLIENIQRENLNPMEQAIALQRFHDEFGMNQQQIATTVGKARSTVTNLLRLNVLNDSVKQLLLDSKLDMGHARAILALKNYQQLEVANLVIKNQWSVRQTEQHIRQLQLPQVDSVKDKINQNELDQLKRRLSERLGAEISIDHSQKGRGKLVIKYHSLDELEGILDLIDPSA